MLAYALKFLIYFCLSFFILSLPVKDKNVFFYMSKYAYPFTRKATYFLEDKLIRSTRKASDVINKLPTDYN